MAWKDQESLASFAPISASFPRRDPYNRMFSSFVGSDFGQVLLIRSVFQEDKHADHPKHRSSGPADARNASWVGCNLGLAEPEALAAQAEPNSVSGVSAEVKGCLNIPDRESMAVGGLPWAKPKLSSHFMLLLRTKVYMLSPFLLQLDLLFSQR